MIELLQKIKAIEPVPYRILVSEFQVKDSLFRESDCVNKLLQKPIRVARLVDVVRDHETKRTFYGMAKETC
jgi:hypothetical protein